MEDDSTFHSATRRHRGRAGDAIPRRHPFPLVPVARSSGLGTCDWESSSALL